jgi:hypothetical protein
VLSRVTPENALCDDCGHPRHVHEYCNDMYPALCMHVDPIDATTEPNLDKVCWCLNFTEEVPDA